VETAFYLLLVIGTIGFFDVLFFHWYRCRLAERPECHREVFWHTARHLIYALQFLWVANLRVLVGCYLMSVAHAVWPDRLLPTAVVVDPPRVPVLLRGLMTLMGLSALGVFVLDLQAWVKRGRAFRSLPQHVAS
jgi:hypothetical protein